jgi:hypothetical protein
MSEAGTHGLDRRLFDERRTYDGSKISVSGVLRRIAVIAAKQEDSIFLLGEIAVAYGVHQNDKAGLA